MPDFGQGFDPRRVFGLVVVPIHRKRRSIGPWIALLLPAYFRRVSPTIRSRSAHSSSTLASIRPNSSSAETVLMRPPEGLNLLPLAHDLAPPVLNLRSDMGKVHARNVH